MLIKTLAQRAVIAVALATALLAAPATITTATAGTTATYWTFRNLNRNACLEGNGAGKVFVDFCDGTGYQDWDWVGTPNQGGEMQLKNRATGLCLMTDIKSGFDHPNAVWGSTCNSSATGQRWFFDYFTTGDTGWMYNGFDTMIRTSPGNEWAVYSDNNSQISDDWYDWRPTIH